MEDLQLVMHDFYNSCPLLMLSCADSQPKNSIYANAYNTYNENLLWRICSWLCMTFIIVVLY